jgi:hypothetical protein
MKKQWLRISLGIVLMGVLFSACDKDDDKKEENEEEVITTMVLKFTPVGTGSTIEFKYEDADGPGGAAPTKNVITLAPFKTYTVELLLLNKTVNPIDTVSEEVEEEAEAHRFYFEPTAGSNINVSGFDTDANNVPVGLNSTWTTSAVATGKVKITLRHYAGNPPGKAVADLVNSTKSSTDMEVEFDTKVQ